MTNKTTAETPPETPPTPTEAKTKAKPVKVLVVVGKREGFRRAGYAFGKEEVRLLVSDLTAEQVKMLKSEPMLVVTETTQDAQSE